MVLPTGRSSGKAFLHKTSAAITRRYDVISVESLDMKTMSDSLCLGKATLDNGYWMFCSMLAYKQTREGHILKRVEKHFPSRRSAARNAAWNMTGTSMQPSTSTRKV